MVERKDRIYDSIVHAEAVLIDEGLFAVLY